MSLLRVKIVERHVYLRTVVPVGLALPRYTILVLVMREIIVTECEAINSQSIRIGAVITASFKPVNISLQFS